MKNCLMLSPNATDGVSLYRHWGPMIELEKQGFVKLITPPNDAAHSTHWQYFKKSHFVFMNRPTRLQDKVMFDEAKKHGLPVWIDMDDNCFQITDDNEESFKYYSDQAQGILAYCLRGANRVSVATKQLYDFLNRELKGELNLFLIPNGLDDSLLMYKKEWSPAAKTIWRGSKAGLAAVLYYAEPIEKLVRETVISGMAWEFFGLNPFFINRHFKPHPIKWQSAVNFIDYIISLNKSKGGFSIMTHLDTEFDRTKSINGFLESTLCGQICMVPDIGQWEEIPDDACFKYKVMKTDSFYETYKEMVGCNSTTLRQIHFNAWKYVENNYLLSNMNKLRINLIEGLFNG